MPQYSLRRHSSVNATTDVTAYTTVAFSVTPLSLRFPSVLLHFPFVTFHLPLTLLWQYPSLLFYHFHICQFVCLPCLSFQFFSWRSLFMFSSLSLRLSQQCPESKRSWLTQFVLRLSAWEKRTLCVRNQERCFSHCAFDSAPLSRRHADIRTHTRTLTKTLWLSHHQGGKI